MHQLLSARRFRDMDNIETLAFELFAAIFDADFLPEKDFLLRAIPVFQDKNVGFVQGRWTYLNAAESLFCRYQVSRKIAYGNEEHWLTSSCRLAILGRRFA